MNKEEVIKVSIPMFEAGELERFDNNIHSIIEEYSKLMFKEKDQILTQRIIIKQEEEIEKLTRQIEIMKKYFQLIIDIGYDYDGYRKAENLMELIDELVEYAYEGKVADDHTCHMIDSDENKYNILGEKIEEENK